jgi:hypothetical protein
MSLHMEGPWLTTTGKKKGKKKFASSEAKRNAEQLEQEWIDLNNKWKPTTVKKIFKEVQLSPKSVNDRVTQHIPSLVTPGGNCDLKDTPVYSGNKVIGIAILHKSCLQPVFSQQEAEDIAHMRR